MPIQCNITQSNGAIAAWHVVENAVANFGATPPNAFANISSYLNQEAAAANDQPLGSANVDISLLMTSAITASPSLLNSIEQYLLTTTIFTGGTQF